MVDTTVNLRDRLVAREIDVACLMGPVAKPEMANRPACTFRLAWAASSKLQLPRRPLELRDVANLPSITYPASPARSSSLTICSADLRPAEVTWSSSPATTIQLAVDGFGIAAIPPEVIHDPLARSANLRSSVPAALTTTLQGGFRNTVCALARECGLGHHHITSPPLGDRL